MRDEIEVMRVVRVPPMGKLVVQAGGERLESLSQTRNDQVKHRLLAAIGELISFTGGYEVLVDAGVAPPLATVPATQASSEETLSEDQAAFLNQLERELREDTASARANEPPPADVSELVELENAAQPGSSNLNLVAEIDAILQKHIRADPTLAERSIHLEQPSGGLLQIRVDGKQYEHPNDIEDQNVRQALKQALKEWEAR